VPDSHQYALAIFMRRARRIRALMIAQNRALNFPVPQSQSLRALGAPPYHQRTTETTIVQQQLSGSSAHNQ